MIVVLDNIRSLHNVGSFFRTADALGIEKIYLAGITPAPIDRFGRVRQRLAKVSLGAEKTVSWEKVSSSLRTIKRLQQARKKIFAVEQSRQAIPYYKLSFSGRLWQKAVLVFGNEIRGLPMSILKTADKILQIPMAGRKESLNVAVSFGIVGFHLRAPAT